MTDILAASTTDWSLVHAAVSSMSALTSPLIRAVGSDHCEHEPEQCSQNNIRPPTIINVTARIDRKAQSGIWTAR